MSQPTGGTNKNKTMQLKGMRIFHCGQYTAAGTSDVLTITGVEATDLAFANMADGGNIGVDSLVCTADTVTIQYDGTAAGVANLLIMRP